MPPHALAEVGPSAGRFGAATLGDLGPSVGRVRRRPGLGVLGDRQAALFGRACFEPGMVKVTYGTGSFALAMRGPNVRPRLTASRSAVAWDLGDHADDAQRPRRLHARGIGLRVGAAIQWLRDGLGIIASAAERRTAGRVVPDSGGVTFVPALTGLGSPWWDPRPEASSPASPAASAAPSWRGPASRPWRSRCATWPMP